MQSRVYRSADADSVAPHRRTFYSVEIVQPAVSSSWDLCGAESRPPMTLLNDIAWEIAAWLRPSSPRCGALRLWLLLRKRPTRRGAGARAPPVPGAVRAPGRRHAARHLRGRPAEDGRTLTMLLFNYRIGGVDYECSQDITAMRDVVDRRAGARRLSLLGALPARQSAKQHRGGRRLDRPARGPAAYCPPTTTPTRSI